MMMLEHVDEVIRSLPVDRNEQLKFVAIDKNGQPQVADRMEDIFWRAAKEAYLFFFKSPSDCIIRHIDEDYRVHKQILLHNGFVICVDCEADRRPLELSLYKGKRRVESKPLDNLSTDSFYETFNLLWDEYLAYSITKEYQEGLKRE